MEALSSFRHARTSARSSELTEDPWFKLRGNLTELGFEFGEGGRKSPFFRQEEDERGEEEAEEAAVNESEQRQKATAAWTTTTAL